MSNLKELSRKHSDHYMSKLLIYRRELSLDDLKAIETFAEKFDLNVNVQENLGCALDVDGRVGLMVQLGCDVRF